MANIRIKDLPVEGAPNAGDRVPIDLGTTRQATVESFVMAGRPTASKYEAEVGTDPKKAMTPLTVKQAIESQVASKFVPNTRKVNTNNGLTGGGDLTGDVTLGLNSASLSSLAKANTAVQTVNNTAPSSSGNVNVSGQEIRLKNNIQEASDDSYTDDVRFLHTAGYYTAGDGGGSLYKRVSAQPSHAGKFQSSDDAWWELVVQDIVRPEFFGAKADGVFDCSNALQDAIDYCMAKAVYGVGLLPRTYAVSRRIIHKKGVSIFGVMGTATIKALAGTADTLMATENYEWLVSTGNSSPGGSQNFTLSNLVLDGNMAENGADTLTKGDGLALYGRNFRLTNVTIKNAPRHGLVCYYVNASGAWGISPYNANLEGVTIDVCGGHGIFWSISDSNWNNINIASPSQLTDGGFDAVVIMSLVRWTNGAIWKKGSGTNGHRYGIHTVSDGCSIVGVNVETSRSHGVFSEGSRCSFDVWVYNILGKYSFYNTGNYNVINLRASGSFQTHAEATALRNSGTHNVINVLSTGLVLAEFASGSNFNVIKATGYVGSKAARTGTFGPYDKVDILAETVTSPIITQQLGAIMRHGSNIQRPSFGVGNYGTYYDTSLKKLLIWDGTKWVDTMGAAV